MTVPEGLPAGDTRDRDTADHTAQAQELGGVEVPATCANLGPGFDAFAVAVDRRLVVRATQPGERRVTAEGAGADELPHDDRNLIWRALVAYCREAGVATPDVGLRAHNAIPLERGLGSSAAAAVAGAALGRALTGAGGRDQDLVDVAARLEGHPDNAAAAVLGGLVVCSGGRVVRLDPVETVRPVVCVPPARSSTAASRGWLPDRVSLADAAANGARAALVLAGLAGAVAFDPAAMHDVLHEPARLAAMPDSAALVESLRRDGIGACLSGAGPSVLALVAGDDDEQLAAVRRRAGEAFSVWPTRWDLSGAAVHRQTVAAPG